MHYSAYYVDPDGNTVYSETTADRHLNRRARREEMEEFVAEYRSQSLESYALEIQDHLKKINDAGDIIIKACENAYHPRMGFIRANGLRDIGYAMTNLVELRNILDKYMGECCDQIPFILWKYRMMIDQLLHRGGTVLMGYNIVPPVGIYSEDYGWTMPDNMQPQFDQVNPEQTQFDQANQEQKNPGEEHDNTTDELYQQRLQAMFHGADDEYRKLTTHQQPQQNTEEAEAKSKPQAPGPSRKSRFPFEPSENVALSAELINIPVPGNAGCNSTHNDSQESRYASALTNLDQGNKSDEESESDEYFTVSSGVSAKSSLSTDLDLLYYNTVYRQDSASSMETAFANGMMPIANDSDTDPIGEDPNAIYKYSIRYIPEPDQNGGAAAAAKPRTAKAPTIKFDDARIHERIVGIFSKIEEKIKTKKAAGVRSKSQEEVPSSNQRHPTILPKSYSNEHTEIRVNTDSWPLPQNHHQMNGDHNVNINQDFNIDYNMNQNANMCYDVNPDINMAYDMHPDMIMAYNMNFDMNMAYDMSPDVNMGYILNQDTSMGLNANMIYNPNMYNGDMHYYAHSNTNDNTSGSFSSNFPPLSTSGSVSSKANTNSGLPLDRNYQPAPPVSSPPGVKTWKDVVIEGAPPEKVLAQRLPPRPKPFFSQSSPKKTYGKPKPHGNRTWRPKRAATEDPDEDNVEYSDQTAGYGKNNHSRNRNEKKTGFSDQAAGYRKNNQNRNPNDKRTGFSDRTTGYGKNNQNRNSNEKKPGFSYQTAGYGKNNPNWNPREKKTGFSDQSAGCGKNNQNRNPNEEKTKSSDQPAGYEKHNQNRNPKK